MTQDEVGNTSPSLEPLLACSSLFLKMVDKDPTKIKVATGYIPTSNSRSEITWELERHQ